MLHTKFQGHQSTGSREEDSKGFYHIWVGEHIGSCDRDGLNMFIFPPIPEALYEILL